jgi:hypothetical protein
MNTETVTMSARRTPWHLWVVGILTLLWDGSGAYTILLAQAGKLADVTPGEASYYATQPLWFVIATDIALFGATIASLALLLRSPGADHVVASAAQEATQPAALALNVDRIIHQAIQRRRQS